MYFTSDNGPAITGIHPHGSTGGLREKKGHLYEGGIRVPGILQWPGRTKPNTVSDLPVSGVDLLPTLCDIAGVHVPGDRVLDGASFVPVLTGQPISRPRPLYWHYLRASSAPKVAMRVGDWKILARLDAPELKRGASLVKEEMVMLKTAGLDGWELYNLKADPAESRDLAADEPQQLARLSRMLQAAYEEVRTESPVWPEWEWPRYESERIGWPAYRNRPKTSKR